MPRPCKKRLVCNFPRHTVFYAETGESQDSIIMTIDEYEIIRLIDLEKYTQEECAIQMQVARTTVQSMYTSARNKLAQTLVYGKKLLIQGGNVAFCSENEIYCKRHNNSRCCCKSIGDKNE
ncbi:MAG: DUF134 domain-containing protein [Spirochaetaceae bacterium]|nr:DUF134 domain-containing protein [Spirochaetaceae bacterium]